MKSGLAAQNQRVVETILFLWWDKARRSYVGHQLCFVVFTQRNLIPSGRVLFPHLFLYLFSWCVKMFCLPDWVFINVYLPLNVFEILFVFHLVYNLGQNCGGGVVFHVGVITSWKWEIFFYILIDIFHVKIKSMLLIWILYLYNLTWR